MTNITIADQLDDAIEMMMAEPGSASPKVDLKIGGLLGIAAELRLLPDPAFRATLKAELLAQSRSTPMMEHADSFGGVPEWEPWGKSRKVDDVLPSLFGAGYGNFPIHRGNFAISMAIHVALIALVAASGLWITGADRSQLTQQVVCILRLQTRPDPFPASVSKSGGGGQHEKLPESEGNLPRFAREQLTPPTIVVPREQPKLAEDMTLIGPPELSKPQTSQIGNPLASILGPPSNGSGSGGGIGTGHGGGIGGGEGAYRVGGGVTAPRPIFDPDPEYSDEARQAKYQGTVMLWAVVGADGKAHEIQVQRSLGMGLDEKAIEAVRGWKFAPGMKDGVPVPVQVNIEVEFRLL
jgi:TonB family protein